jgi:hypothetical protein
VSAGVPDSRFQFGASTEYNHDRPAVVTPQGREKFQASLAWQFPLQEYHARVLGLNLSQ